MTKKVKIQDAAKYSTGTLTPTERNTVHQIEEWMDIPGYEGKYQISNYGNVKSLGREYLCKNGVINRVKTRIRKHQKERNGYHLIKLNDVSENRSPYLVHRLVANAFIPNLQNLPFINHIDGNKDNNHSTNLEWCTHKYNMRHACNLGLVSMSYLKAIQLRGYERRRMLISFKIENLIKKDRNIRPTHAIRELGITRRYLNRIAKEYNIEFINKRQTRVNKGGKI